MRIADASTPAVVLTASPAPLLHGALGVVRSLARLGVPVHLVHDERRAPTDRSRYLRGVFVARYDQAQPDRFLDDLAAVGRRLGRPAVLVPIDDLGALFVADHADALREWFLFPDLAADTAHALASKRSLYLLCRRLDVPTPETLFPGDRDEALALCERMGLPVVVKAIDPPLLYQRAQARSVVVARSRRELLDAYDRLEVPGGPTSCSRSTSRAARSRSGCSTATWTPAAGAWSASPAPSCASAFPTPGRPRSACAAATRWWSGPPPSSWPRWATGASSTWAGATTPGTAATSCSTSTRGWGPPSGCSWPPTAWTSSGAAGGGGGGLVRPRRPGPVPGHVRRRREDGGRQGGPGGPGPDGGQAGGGPDPGEAGMTAVRLRTACWYGDRRLPLELPTGWRVTTH
jgi:hypothetical protein